MRPAGPLLAALAVAVLAVVAGTPARGDAAGFGAPRALSTRTGNVDSPLAAVAPNGRTAVLWQGSKGSTGDASYVVALGPDPGRLGRPTALRAAHRFSRTSSDATVLARPGGGFVACFAADPRRGDAVSGCSFASPHGGFGPLHVAQRRPWRERPGLTAAVRADGRLVLVLSRRIGHGRRTLVSTTMDAGGRRGRPRVLATVDNDAPVALAAVADGTVAVAWATAAGREELAPRVPSLRLMRPGSDRFGASVRFTPDRRVDGGVGLVGGAGLLVSYQHADETEANPTRATQMLRDGSFTPPLAVPSPGPGFVEGSLVQLADGTPFAVSGSSQFADTDCSDVVSGAIGAGPLVRVGTPGRAQSLSTPGQIALDAQAQTLTDGTVVATWGDAAGEAGNARVEVGLRPPGAAGFDPPQALPGLAARTPVLAVGGDQAILAWVVGAIPFGPAQIVVSSLRGAPPYAAPAPLPAHPRASCS